MLFRKKMKRKSLRGMSLIEMLMAIFILLIGLEGITLLFLNSWKMNKFVLETGNASLIASRTVEVIVRDIRRARQADNGDYPIESGGDSDLKVYIDIDGDGVTERVRWGYRRCRRRQTRRPNRAARWYFSSPTCPRPSR